MNENNVIPYKTIIQCLPILLRRYSYNALDVSPISSKLINFANKFSNLKRKRKNPTSSQIHISFKKQRGTFFFVSFKNLYIIALQKKKKKIITKNCFQYRGLLF